MRNNKGNITGIYNIIIDYKNNTKKIFSDYLDVPENDININLRYTDLSIQIIINSEKIIKKQKSKIIFIIDRMDGYETYGFLSEIKQPLHHLIKIKDRRKKLNKLTKKIYQYNH